MKESHDWELTYTYKKNGIKANAFYSTKIERFLPNFKFAQIAAAYLIDVIVPMNLIDTAKVFFELPNQKVRFINNFSHTFSMKM